MFLFIILSCIGVVCAMDVNKSSDSSLNTTASASYDNNLIQDVDDDLYDDEIIPDNNFEDGYENSEIIELNDTTVDEDGEEFIEDVTSTGSIRHIPSKVRGSGDISAIVSNTTTALSVKVVLNKLTSTTYNATFSGVNNSFKEMVIQETTGIGWSNLVDFGYSYFGLKTSN